MSAISLLFLASCGQKGSIFSSPMRISV
ncbi:lipoprotein [Pseudomonas silesiensis]